jgi:hypothetical protein
MNHKYFLNRKEEARERDTQKKKEEKEKQYRVKII